MTKQTAKKILGVESCDDVEEINFKYRCLIKKYHPDTYKFGKIRAENKTIAIIKAYNVLIGEEPETVEKVDIQKNKLTINKEYLWALIGGIVLTIILIFCFLLILK